MRKKGLAVLLSAAMVSATLAFTPMDVQAATTLYDSKTGTEDGYDYELWKDRGTTSMTLTGNGTFECSWSNINNALFRTGKKFDQTKTYQQLGNISVEYGCDYQPNGNSYLCVYGWTVDPLVEYYVVDSWGTWRPPGSTPKGQITVDGATYDVYETTRYNQPSIKGDTTFQQYWSVRTTKRTSGTITVSDHFKAWESMGMKMGKMYETALTVEGYQSSGTAKVYKHNITIGGSSNNSGNNNQGNNNQGNNNQGNTTQPDTNTGSVNTKSTIQVEDMTLSGTYAGKINSPFSGVALYANNDKVSWTQSFGAGTHDFTLRGCSNNSKMAAVDLYIGGAKKGTFYFGDQYTAEYTIKNVSHATGNQKIELVVSTDDGTWDAYIDSLKISAAGSTSDDNNQGSNNNQGNNNQTQQPEQGNNNQGQTQQPEQGNNNNQGNNQGQTQPSNPGTTQPSAAGISCEYKTTGDWGSGFQGEIIVKNNTNTTYNGWTLTFDSAAKITSLWGGSLVGQSGKTVTVKNCDWDMNFAPGATVSIGFVADGSSKDISNFKFNNEAANQGGSQAGNNNQPQQPEQNNNQGSNENQGNNNQGQTQPSNPGQTQPQPSTGIVRPSQVSLVKSTPSDAARQQAGVQYGTVKRGTYYSNITNSYRPYNIYLPANYSSAKKYPVIYMLHGIGGNQDAFGASEGATLMRMAANLAAKGEAEECIIVFPYIRVSTTPETNIFDANNYKYYDMFREELINNLMPHINTTYSTKTGRENTAVAGFSMGGRESLYIGISKADLFGYTGAFCPAPGNLPNYMNGVYEAGLFSTNGFKLPAAYNENTLVMIVKGASDGVVGDQPLLYHNTLQANGTDHVYYEIPGGHDEGVYGNGFYNFLRYVFK